MTKKLWSFGCSWAAGASLGTGITKEDLKKWYLLETGHDNFQDGIERKSLSEIDQERILSKWNVDISNAKSPELSYAGKLADKLGLKLMSFAISGTGNDRAYLNLQKYVDIIDWDNDLVLFDLCPVYRYMIDSYDKKFDLQLSLIDDPKSSQYVPTNKTMEMLTMGILSMINCNFNSKNYKEYPLVHFVNTNLESEQNIIDLSNIHFANALSIRDIGENMCGKYWRYPSGHAIESVHDAFADNILEDRFIAEYAKRNEQ